METLDIRPRQIVIHLCGAVDEHSAPQISAQFQAALQGDDNAPLWIDMSRVEFMDSAGFSALLAAYALTRQRGQQMVLYQASAPVRLILELTGLDQYLTLIPSPIPHNDSLPITAP
ncbi:STAS domain-containing protein [Nodosilinea nodulosa]|uniref:STAS domain-containing protein n=1 Tax=Nodosilinea nodulosa TaxID=416001 RepID=UPI0002E040C3|nr:STAS domain-containing protein [Nodosilinea nodulosa]